MPLNLLQLSLIFIAEILVLYKLSNILIQSIGRRIANLTHSRRITMYVLAILFLPGTVIHELAHWIVARVLMVPAGEVVLWPKLEPEGFRLGSVSIAKTDVLRRFLIGMAPFLVGNALIFLSIWLIMNQNQVNWWQYILAGYGVFEIANTMFSSKRDLEGSSVAIAFIFAILASIYLFGITIPPHLLEQIKNLFSTASIYLIIPICIDLGLVVISKIL